MFISKCLYCGEDIKSSYRKKFCSISCSASYRNKLRNKAASLQIEKKCVLCGKIFVPKGREIFCSDECKRINKIVPTLSKYFGMDTSKIGTEHIISEYSKIRDVLYKKYWVDEETSSEIAKEYNYPSVSNITGKIFKYLNIPSRSCADTNSILFYKGSHKINNSCYSHQGWHTTWDGNEVYLRSSYEEDYAKLLDESKIKYDTEALRIKYYNSSEKAYRCAIPDFYIEKYNRIVEIKSNWTFDYSEMVDKATEYVKLGYDFRLILEHKEYSYNELIEMNG